MFFIQSKMESKCIPDTPYNKFKSIIRCYNAHIIKEEEKLPEISLHGLRHTSATLMISQNVDIRTVSNRLGHAQTSTTLDIYSHALQKWTSRHHPHLILCSITKYLVNI